MNQSPYKKIIKAKAFAVRIPMLVPFKFSLGEITHSSQVFVKIEDGLGNIGWGETTTFLPVFGYDQNMILKLLENYLLPNIIGLIPEEIQYIHQVMDRIVPSAAMAKAAIDLALYDLVSRKNNESLCKYLSGELKKEIPVCASIGLVDADKAIQLANHFLREGFSAIKLKVGGDFEADIKRLQRVVEAVGYSLKIRIDANMCYTRSAASKMLECLDQMSLECIEQPLAAEDIEGHTVLAKKYKTPIAIDEGIFTKRDAYCYLKAKAVDLVNIKLVKCGGILRAIEIAQLAEQFDVPCFLGGCGEMTLGALAGLHFYSAIENLTLEPEIDIPIYCEDVAEEILSVNKISERIASAKGVGVNIDIKKIKKYQEIE